uniref:Uncharacterized protein n=1 Tax=Glossina austeni TaxID=7395 RepID=A0A1A9VT22_GLOAU
MDICAKVNQDQHPIALMHHTILALTVSRLMDNAERALVPYNPERRVVRYNPERALVPYNPERALIPYNQERGLVPLVRGDADQGAIVRPSFYDSFNQRFMFRGRSDVLSFICIFKGFMGCGIFAMPVAFMHGGAWWTLMHLLTFAGILYGCIYMLVNCAHTLESRYKIPVLSYSQLGMTALVHGPPFLSGFYQIPKLLINFFQFLASICLCGLYVMFITHNMCDVGDFLVPSDIVDFKMWRPFVLVVAVALVLPCILCYLNLYCLLGILAQLLALGLGFINYVFTELPEVAEVTTAFLPEKDMQFVFLMCSIIMYLIEGITIVMPVENSMNNPRHLIGCPSILLTGMVLVTVFKAVVGLTGYMRYKHQTLPFITSNMPKDRIIMPACIELCVHYREYGVLKWRLILNTTLVLFGLAAAGILTYGSIGSCAASTTSAAIAAITVMGGGDGGDGGVGDGAGAGRGAFRGFYGYSRVYIVGHIPPGSDERHIGLQQNGHTTFTETNNKRYLELVRKYSSIIQGQFFGHLHSDSFRIIYDDKGKPVSWMMISPSVTPRKMSIGSNNPAMRLYKFDTDSGQVLDYTQYYTDLSAANANVEPNWVPEYNLTHYYALTDISAISLHNFVDRFTSGDESWFLKYYRANTVRYHNDRCDAVCMLNHYCAITRIDYKEFRQCLEKEQNALRSKAIRSTLDRKSLYVFALVLLVMNMMRIHGILRWLAWNYTKVITNCQQRCQPLLFGMRRQKSNACITISDLHNVYMKPMTTIVKRMRLKVDWADILSSSSHMHCDTKTKDFLVDIKSYRVETIITMTEANKPTATSATNLVKVRTHTCNYCLQQKPEQRNDVTERLSSISSKARCSMAVMLDEVKSQISDQNSEGSLQKQGPFSNFNDLIKLKANKRKLGGEYVLA